MVVVLLGSVEHGDHPLRLVVPPSDEAVKAAGMMTQEHCMASGDAFLPIESQLYSAGMVRKNKKYSCSVSCCHAVASLCYSRQQQTQRDKRPTVFVTVSRKFTRGTHRQFTFTDVCSEHAIAEGLEYLRGGEDTSTQAPKRQKIAAATASLSPSRSAARTSKTTSEEKKTEGSLIPAGEEEEEGEDPFLLPQRRKSVEKDLLDIVASSGQGPKKVIHTSGMRASVESNAVCVHRVLP